MKTFEVKALGLEEMTSAEVNSVNGGIGIIAGLILGIVVGAIVDAILDPETAQKDFERGRDTAKEQMSN